MPDDHALPQRGERALNDNRSSAQPGEPAPTAKRPAPHQPSRRDRWQTARPSKMTAFLLCLGAVALTMAIGFSWGGWTTTAAAEKQATSSAQSAVAQRLATICVAQFDLDANHAQNLTDLQGLSTNQRGNFITDGGWANMPGETAPEAKVASECVKRLMVTASK